MWHHDVPDYLQSFLMDPGSLTKKLRMLAGSANVKVLSGDFKSPDWWCRYYLKLDCDKLFQREILMTSGSFSCWYARSYIPATTWLLYSTFFAQLSIKNLSDLLFDDRHVQRISVTYFAIGKSDLPYYWPPEEAILSCDKLWLRLSTFSLNKQANFYLTELFLPELQACLQQSGQLIGD